MNPEDHELVGTIGALVLIGWLVGAGIVIGRAVESEVRRRRLDEARLRSLERSWARLEGIDAHLAEEKDPPLVTTAAHTQNGGPNA